MNKYETMFVLNANLDEEATLIQNHKIYNVANPGRY